MALGTGTLGVEPLGGSKRSGSVAIGRASEADTGRALTAVRAVTIGRATTTSSARTLTATITVTIGRATETDTGRPLTAHRDVAVSRAGETDLARAVSVATDNAKPIGRAGEADLAQPLTAAQLVALTRAAESDTARVLAIGTGLPITRVVETDTGRTLDSSQAIAIGRAGETDVARHVDNGQLDVPIGRATELEEAWPVLVETDPMVGVTQLSWHDGRRREGSGTATWEPAVVAPSRTVPAEVALIKAHAIDDVVSVGARVQLEVRTVSRARDRHRIKVNHHDATYVRGIETPEPITGLIEPLLYGSGSIRWPQFNGTFDRAGHGDWWFLTKEAPVEVQRVNAAGHVVATDFRGYIADFDPTGRDFVTALKGEATGRGEQYREPPVFAQTQDIGRQVIMAVRHGLRLPTMDNPPVTGIKVPDKGDMSQMDFINDLTARSTTLGGAQWTVMPNAAGVYRMFRKDVTTIDFTVYCDDARMRPDLRRDFAEETDRLYATALNHNNGMRIRFIQSEGLVGGPPPGFPGHLEEGDYGNGVLTLVWRLQTMGRLDPGVPNDPASFTPAVTKAVKELQDDADLDITGEVNAATWSAAFDHDVTGWALRNTRIAPAAKKGWVNAYKRNGSGVVIGRNSRYRRKGVINDRIVDMGNVDSRSQAKDWAVNALSDDNAPNLVGTIDITMGAVIAGEHHPGDPLSSADLMDARAIRPGMNVLVHHQGAEVLMHVATRDIQEGRAVQIAVDTRCRNALEVWEIHQRNRDSHRSLERQWKRDNRSSTMGRDAMSGWDEIGGLIDSRIYLPDHRWVVFEVAAGQQGQIRELILQTVNDPAEFVLAIFGKRITRQRIANLIGNPFTDDGKRNWRRHGDTLRNQHLFLYEAGWDTNPCGYHPTTKPEANADFPAKVGHQVTGKFVDAAGFPYFSEKGVVWFTMMADRDTHLEPGRIMKVQLSDQV